MTFSIDHVVIASDDLDVAIANARSAGFTVIAGGVHGSGNTHNALIAFGDGSYLELFAPTAQGRSAEHRWFARIRNGGGLVDFCLLGASLAREIARIRQQDIAYSQPFPMARVTPDETRIEWLLSTPPGVTGERGWPFMIEDITPRAIRVPHAPEQVVHANGAQGVAGITVLVRSVDASSQSFEAILGTAAQQTSAAGRRFLIAGAWIHVREPRSADEKRHVERHGQGPYQLQLRSGGAVGAGNGTLLDPALFSGARITIG